MRYVDDTEFGGEEFLFVNLMEAHSPYDPPKPDAETELGSSPNIEGTVTEADVDPGRLKQAYEESVAYLADMYDRLLERIRDEFDYIITLSDHGERFGEYGHWGHCQRVTPELTNVPLVVAGNDMSDETVSRPVSLVDVHATVLEMAGLEGSGERPSRSLLDRADRPILTERFGFNREAIENASSGTKTAAEPYDTYLRGVATEDGYTYESIDGVEYRGQNEPVDPDRFEGFFEDLDAWSEESSDGDVSEAVKQQLEELGYA